MGTNPGELWGGWECGARSVRGSEMEERFRAEKSESNSSSSNNKTAVK